MKTSQSTVTEDNQWLPREGRSGQEELQRGTKKHLAGMDMVIILTMVMNSQVYTYVKADQIMHFLTCVVYCMSVVHQWSYFSKSNPLEWDNTLRFYLYTFKPLVKQVARPSYSFTIWKIYVDREEIRKKLLENQWLPKPVLVNRTSSMK